MLVCTYYLKLLNLILGDSFDFETFLKMYKMVKKLGEGGYGQVILGRHIITNEELAIKIMMPSHIIMANEAGKVFKEAQML